MICDSTQCTIALPTNSSKSLGNDSFYTDLRHLSSVESSIIMALAGVTMVCNLLVLLASKFTSGGESPTLVFVRSLCVSDVLVGLYAILKMTMFLVEDDKLLVNFFLPESLFFTASLAYAFSLLCLNFDCLMKLTQPMWYMQQFDKKNIISIMVMFWNVSFVVGFLPQMGWNNIDYVHRFFVYFSWHYLLFVAVLLVTVFLCNCVILITLKRHFGRVRRRRHFVSPTSSTFRHYGRIIVTTFIDMCLLVLCYVPLFGYYAFFCNVCVHFPSVSADVNVAYFIPVFLVKSFVTAVVHGYRTAQINEVMKGFRRRLSQVVRKSLQPSVRSGTRNSLKRDTNSEISQTSYTDIEMVSQSVFSVTEGYVNEAFELTRL